MVDTNYKYYLKYNVFNIYFLKAQASDQFDPPEIRRTISNGIIENKQNIIQIISDGSSKLCTKTGAGAGYVICFGKYLIAEGVSPPASYAPCK